MIADTLSRVFINPFLVLFLSDSIPHSIESPQPLPTFKVLQEFSSSSKVIPSLSKPKPYNSLYRIPPITPYSTSITL